MITAFAALVIYVVGLATQIVARLVFQKGVTISFPPFVCFRYAFFFDYSKYVWLAVGVIAVVIIGYSVTMSDKRGKVSLLKIAVLLILYRTETLHNQ